MKSTNLAIRMDNKEVVLKVVSKKDVMTDPLDKLINRKPMRRHLTEFGIVFAIVALLAACYCFLSLQAPLSGYTFTLAGIAIAALGFRAPAALHTPWKAWMALGNYLGMAVTAMLLSAMWLGMFIPMSLVLRTIGKRVMNMNFRENRESYWQDRDPSKDDFRLLERQY